MNNTEIYTLAPHYRFQWEEAQQSYVMLFPEGMIKLNGGAGEVIRRVDGKRSVDEIVHELKLAFPDVDDIESDVVAMIQLAVEKSWLVLAN